MKKEKNKVEECLQGIEINASMNRYVLERKMRKKWNMKENTRERKQYNIVGSQKGNEL